MELNDMGDKLGRNALCWCGSGEKFKKCHLNREEEARPTEWELINKQKKEFSKKYCLCPEEYPQKCEGKIINAHTVSKKSSLKNISVNSHVYVFLLSPEAHLKLRKAGKVIEPELRGINIVSTFTGFCRKHDGDLFKELDDKEFISSKKQIFLHLYRTLSREIFGKQSQVNSIDALKDGDRGLNVFEQQLYQESISSLGFGAELANNDLDFQKKRLDQILIRKEYNSVEGFVMTCDKAPTLVCSGAIFPHYDFQGNRIQDLSDPSTRLHSISINIVSSKESGYIIFSWIKDDRDSYEKFIESLKSIDSSKYTNAIIRFLFEYIENRFANPTWWDSLPKEKQSKLNKKFTDSVRSILRTVY